MSKTELCSTPNADPCPDYLMRELPGGIVPLQSQFPDAPPFYFDEVFAVNLYPDEVVNLTETLSDRDKFLPMSEQVKRLKLAEWIGLKTRAVLVEQAVFS